jgi:hypothetical protein
MRFRLEPATNLVPFGPLLRRVWATGLFLGALGCGEAAATPAPSSSAAGAAAGAPAAAGQSAAEGEVPALVSALITAYDRAVTIDCPCQVAMHGYASIEECTMWQGSGPDWVDCATGVLAQHDTPANRGFVLCFTRLISAGADCKSMVACDSDERAHCVAECLGDNTVQALALALTTQCPDTGLLTRQ